MGKNGTITVIKEGDVYGTDYKFEIRKTTPQKDLQAFVEKFKDNEFYLSEFVTIEKAEEKKAE